MPGSPGERDGRAGGDWPECCDDDAAAALRRPVRFAITGVVLRDKDVVSSERWRRTWPLAGPGSCKSAEGPVARPHELARRVYTVSLPLAINPDSRFYWNRLHVLQLNLLVASHARVCRWILVITVLGSLYLTTLSERAPVIKMNHCSFSSFGEGRPRGKNIS